MADNSQPIKADTDIQSFMFQDDARAFRVRVPRGLQFVSVINPNPKLIGLYYGEVSAETADPRDSIIALIPYQNQTYPINQGDVFTLVGQAGGGSDQRVQLIFSNVNLGLNNSTSQPGGQSSVNIASDSAGLAKASQFPTALSNGALRTTVEGDMDVNVLNPITIANDDTQPISVKGQFTASPDVSTTFDTFDFNVTTGGNQLPGNVCKEIVIVADDSGTSNVLIGKTASSCTFPVQPGQSLSLPVSNTNILFVKSASATVLHVLWRA